MVVILGMTGAFLQRVRRTPGLTGTSYFDRDGAQILVVDLFVDGWRDRGPRRGPRSTGAWCTGYKGCRGTRSGSLILDRAVLVIRVRHRAAETAPTAADGGAPPETRRSWVDLELRASFCDTDRFYVERGTRRTRPRSPEGGSGDGQEPPRPAADGRDRRKAGDVTRHLECEQKRRRWPSYLAAMLHVRSWSRGGSGGGDRARAALRGRKTGKPLAAARFSGGGDTLGRRVFVRMAHATKEDEEAPRKCSLGDEEHRTAGNGWRPEILWAAAHGGER
jgi:hypothetical protein